MYLVIARLVHNAIRSAENLMEAIGVCGDCVETLDGNDWPREREIAYVSCGSAQLALPTKAVINGEGLGNSEDDIVEKYFGVW